jgi:hypothetical protein
MVASYASSDEPEYLNLLPIEEFKSNSQDTAALVDSFNRGYKEALVQENYIVNDEAEVKWTVTFQDDKTNALKQLKDLVITTAIDEAIN